MTKITKYFQPQEDSTYFNQLKTNFFIKICFFGIATILLLLATDVVFNNANFVISFTSKAFTLPLLIGFLFLLKYKGIELSGNIFSTTTLIILLVFINIIPKGVLPISKFIQGFYSVYAYLLVALIFANRKILVFNAVLILITSTSVFFRSITMYPNESNLYTSAYINHTVVLFVITYIAYYINLFIELTINKANKEIKQREYQNQELIISEEEIRASNEELVATADALMEANDEITLEKNRAEESDRLKTEFLNNMSHEVRTPMNGIIGFSQLIDLPDLDEMQRRNYIDIIRQSSNQLLSIIDNIIEISKLGTKQVKVFEQEINITKLFSELYAIFEIQLKEKGVSFFLKNGLPDGACQIYNDEIKIYKILSNLLENAVKFTEKGFVEFGYKIVIDDLGLGSDKSLQFFVKDTGIGIELEKQKLIFDKFSQAEGNLIRHYGGLGLGLSIAKENTTLLGGTICLNSERGVGSEFIVTIPLRSVDKL